MHSFAVLVHLLGLSLAFGAAAIKVALLFRCRSDRELLPVFARVTRPLTRFLITGMAALTLSGAWLAMDTGLTPALRIKLGLVAAVWVLGPVIDQVVEPAFLRLAPASGVLPQAGFVLARRRYVALETIATGLLGASAVLGVLL